MVKRRLRVCGIFAVASLSCLFVAGATQSQTREEREFGPVVRAYLGYLRNEQEVVDDRVSRREISSAYYRRNSNRIRALRQMALQIARESRNDYLPEFEAVTRDEMGMLFEQAPRLETLRVNEVLRSTFRFLGAVRSGEVFYVFARLDPYEQMELAGAGGHDPAGAGSSASPSSSPANGLTRARRTSP
jgi:hypothetical protein